MAKKITYNISKMNPEFKSFKDTPNVNFYLTAQHTVYTDDEINAMNHNQRAKVKINFGTGTWGDKFCATIGSLWAKTENKNFMAGHRATRNYLISLCLFKYTISESVRDWCDANDLTSDAIRDIRGTTDFYAYAIWPKAAETYAELLKTDKTDDQYNLLTFVKDLMGAIALAEHY
jgi:hypothetical protein